MNEATKEIKSLLKTKKLVLGTKQTIKNIKRNKLEKFFIAENCNPETKKDLTQYAKITEVKAINLKNSNQELGVICKKPFAISVVGVLK